MASKGFSVNAKLVYNFIKEVGDKNVTAADISEATGLGMKQVTGIVTSAFQRKGLMERIPAEIELSNGTRKTVKYIKLTDEGKAIDIDAVPDDAE